jgi:outer membrane protein assembly factor BamB
MLPAKAASVKELWHVSKEDGYDFSSIHYSSNTIVVAYSKDDSLYLDRLSYCSGAKLGDGLVEFPENVLPKTVEAYENCLFFVTNKNDSDSFEIICTDLNLSRKWSQSFEDGIEPALVWIETIEDFLIVHLEKTVHVFEWKTGKMLSKLETVFILDSVYSGNILTLTDKLSLVDPYTTKPLWTYEIPKTGTTCFGIRKGIVMLAHKPIEFYRGSIVVCLDANTGQTVFEMEYNYEVTELGIAGDILGIYYRNNKKQDKVDAFRIDDKTFIWSTKARGEAPLFTKDSIYLVFHCCPSLNDLAKINAVDGSVDKWISYFFFDYNETPRFFRNITFQANRVIVAYAGITCYIDESF